MKLSPNAIELLKKRYCAKNEKPNEVYKRVASSLSKGKDKEHEDPFFKIMDENRFLPNSPCIANAGMNNQMKACFVLGVDDSMEGIFQAMKQAAQIFKSGGGVGYNFSNLRQKDAPLSARGTSSGVLSFMKIFDDMTDAIKQGGMRRGASMGILDYDHPEILDFITIKLKQRVLTNFNLSVMLDNQFMKSVESDEWIYLKDRMDKRKITQKIRAKDLFNVIVYSAWLTGDPGVLFYNRINEDNIYYPKYPIVATNPCGEQPLLSNESCCLGSINLNEHITKDGDLDMDKLLETVEIGVKFLLQVNKYTEFPFPELYTMNSRTNRIGLGVMGFADMLIGMSVMYDSNETLKLVDKILKPMLINAKKIAHNSASVLSIAPTGSLSILASCSPGIEPIYSSDYQRFLSFGAISEKRRDSEYLRTAHEITPEWHLKVQSAFQKICDSGVSKTINLNNDASINEVYDVYWNAWKIGCKGITIYRDASKDTQVFVKARCTDESCYL